MKARIYRPTRTAMQSGIANTLQWKLEFVPVANQFIDPLMGWSGQTDTSQEIQMYFPTKEEAYAYAKRNNLEFEEKGPKTRVIKPKSYAANFAFNKVG
jgi:hypothetical protein